MHPDLYFIAKFLAAHMERDIKFVKNNKKEFVNLFDQTFLFNIIYMK